MTRSILDWAERKRPPHREMLAWYRTLLALRHELGELTDGRREEAKVVVDEAARTIVVRRGRLTLVGSISEVPTRFVTPPGRLELAYPQPPLREGDVSVLAPDGCAIWVARQG